MRVSQLIYGFSYKEKSKEKTFSFTNGKVFLCLNGKRSELDVEKTFLKIQKKNESSLKGFSILSKLIKEAGISLSDEAGSEVEVKLETPVFQWSDERLDDEDYQQFFDELKKQTSAQDVADSPSDAKQEQEESRKAQPVLVDKYQELEGKLIKRGFKLEKKGNLSFFFKPGDIEDNLLVLRSEDGEYDFLELEEKDGVLVYDDENETLEISVKDGSKVFFAHNTKKAS